jgi:hypothetical protein
MKKQKLTSDDAEDRRYRRLALQLACQLPEGEESARRVIELLGELFESWLARGPETRELAKVIHLSEINQGEP